jgi:hypothetical protein
MYMHGALDQTQYKKIRSHSSEGQDEFVVNVLKERTGGIFVEVGSHHPSIASNTIALERDYGWSGLAIELDPIYSKMYTEERSSTCVNANALTFDYLKYFKENNFPTQIDYLQIDIDDRPRHANLKALISLPLEQYRFSVITFEHDCVRDFTLKDMRDAQRLILGSYGYDLVRRIKTEDWWIDKSCVPYENYWDLFS